MGRKLVAGYLFHVLVAVWIAAPFPSGAYAQGVRTQNEMLSRFVDRDTRTRLWRAYDINEDCTTVRGFNVRIDRLPKHGEIRLEKIDQTIDASFLNFRTQQIQRDRLRRCRGKEIPVIAVYYTPNKGFTGFDDLLMVSTSASQRFQRVVDFRLAVR